MGRDENRKQRKRVAKMLSISKCYIAVMWDGLEKTPLAVMDAAALRDQKTPVATCFGKIASGIMFEINECKKKADLNQAQLSQLEHAELIREQKSKELQGFLTDEDREELRRKEEEKNAPEIAPGIVAAADTPAPPVPPTLPPLLYDASGRTLPFKTKADKDAEN